MRSKMFVVVLAGCLFVNAGSTFAADFEFLSGPSLMTLSPGADGFWDSGDDFTSPGWKPLGAATSFADSGGNVGFATGTSSTNASGSQTLGVNTLTSGLTTGEFSNPGLGIFFSLFTQTFDPALTNTTTIFANNTTSASYGIDQSDAFGGAKVSVTGDYSRLRLWACGA
jgi:hypothetical protein